jgi:hypothetical protein
MYTLYPIDYFKHAMRGLMRNLITLLDNACAAIRAKLRLRAQRNQQDTPAAARMQWVEKWLGQPIEQWDEREKQKVLQD